MDLTLLRAQYRFLIGMPEDPEKLIEALCAILEKRAERIEKLQKEVDDLEDQYEIASCEAEEKFDALVEGLEQLLKDHQ